MNRFVMNIRSLRHPPLIRAPPPPQKSFSALVKYLEQEETRVCDRIAQYSKRWKQPINVGETQCVPKNIFSIQMQNKKKHVGECASS
jgi:hypothetical protein